MLFWCCSVQGIAVTAPGQPTEQGEGATPSRRILAVISVAAVSVVSRLRRYTAVLKRAALSISLISLAFSGVSLYETVLKQPSLQILAGCNWEYGRGPGSYDEFFVVPVTVTNHGARAGAVLAMELTASKGGQSKPFGARFTVENLDDKRRQLFYLDLDKPAPKLIDTDYFGGFGPTSLNQTWSPDNKWIAYSKQLPSGQHAVFAYSLDENWFIGSAAAALRPAFYSCRHDYSRY